VTTCHQQLQPSRFRLDIRPTFYIWRMADATVRGVRPGLVFVQVHAVTLGRLRDLRALVDRARAVPLLVGFRQVPFGVQWNSVASDVVSSEWSEPPGGLLVGVGCDVRSDELVDVFASGWPRECGDDLAQRDEAVEACPEVGGLREGVGVVG
jgi:hypothetical protein